MSSVRIFWLGCHKVLTKTELPRLRKIGFEVFNPPYLSDVYDQSVDQEWDKNQFTTLPGHIFEKLSKFNFFNNSISPEIALVLNEYFDCVLVTNSSEWLFEILKVYKK